MEDEVWVIRMKPGGMGVDWGVVVMPMVVETNPCMVWLVGFGRGGPLGSWSYDRKHGHDGIHGLNNKLIRQKIEGIIHNLG